MHILIISIILMIYLADNFFCFVFSHIEKTRYENFKFAKQKIEDKRELDRIVNNNSEVLPKWKIIARKLLDFFSGWVRYRLIRLGRIPCHTYRLFILKNIFLMEIEKKVVIYGGFEIRAPWNIHIGCGSIIGDESKLDGRNEIYIGKNVNFSTGVWIWTEQHDINDPFFACNFKGGKVTIFDRAWISNRVIIMPGISINEGAVVAAGAIITKDCEKFTVYAGIPAKPISKRNNNLQYEFDGKHSPFF